MNRTRTIILFAAVASAVFYIACTSSSNPVSNNGSGSGTFVFKLGSSFVFNQYTLDTTSGLKIPGSLKIVHERVVDSGKTIQGKANVFIVYDTTFTDSTATTVAVVDTLYYATNGSVVYQYGFITQLFSILLGPYVPIPPKWDMIANVGSSGWLVDTTMTTPGGLLPLSLTLNGNDDGNVNISASPNALSSDNVAGSGSVVLTDSGKIYAIPISGNSYVSYSPAIVAKWVIAAVKSTPNLGGIPGYERDLVSFSTN